MDFNRNQFMIAGVLMLLLGLQFRLVESFTLNEKTTQFLASRMPGGGASATLPFSSETTGVHKQIHPPSWLGWSLMSIGSVMVLHSLAMKKPGG